VDSTHTPNTEDTGVAGASIGHWPRMHEPSKLQPASFQERVMKLKDIDDPSVQSLKGLLETVLQLRQDIQQMIKDVEAFQPAEFSDTVSAEQEFAEGRKFLERYH
jgi:protein-tyrosine-phosphatase